VCADFAAEGKDCAEVDLQHFVPVVVRELVRRVAALNTTAVEENMDTVAVFEDLRNERVDRGG
jgi:glyoxylate carboligase